MNPKKLAADYADFRQLLQQHRRQLDDYNLGRFDEDYGAVLQRLDNLIEGLESFH